MAKANTGLQLEVAAELYNRNNSIRFHSIPSRIRVTTKHRRHAILSFKLNTHSLFSSFYLYHFLVTEPNHTTNSTKQFIAKINKIKSSIEKVNICTVSTTTNSLWLTIKAIMVSAANRVMSVIPSVLLPPPAVVDEAMPEAAAAEEEVEGSAGRCVLSCTTFNILAPIYKRLDQQNQALRESDFRASWLGRNQMILDWLVQERSSIICLQEFWVGNEELVRMYLERLGEAGYKTFKLGRTNNRGDGLLTAVQKDTLKVLHHRELLFNDFGDRVAQLLHVQLNAPLLQNQRVANFEQEMLIVNTHLLFPHDSSLSIVRLHQVYKILQYVESYQRENQLNPMPIMLCGDWNGSKRGHVYKFLRSQGFESTYDTAHKYSDSDLDAHKWVSHRNHRGNICGVDFIWLCNPNKERKSLKTSWAEAVFSNLKYQLRKASMTEGDAFAFLKGDQHEDFITYPAFLEALRQVKLISVPYGLNFEEIRDLWIQADIDGNGVVNYEEFKQRIWNTTCSDRDRQEEGRNGNPDNIKQSAEEGVTLGFKVKNAALHPREVEKGLWPEHYSLSDHARLTVVLSPVKMQCPLSSNTHSLETS